jgi:8-oxo-dGTP pyrophosphatase MutT (NUDIX family)/endonuclease/exonuclease/phosphatase family metal-dependent hydrolase
MTRLFRRILFLLNLLLVLYSLLVYQLSYAANVQHWLGGFMMLSMPFVLIFNVIFAIIWLFLNSKRWVLSLLCLLVGFPLFSRTFNVNFFKKIDPVIAKKKKISVLSYNLMWCDAKSYYEKHDSTNATLLIQTIKDFDADIKCFQELYNQDNIWAFRMFKKIKEDNPYYTYVHASAGNDKGQGEIGLTIFSKYPILNKREIYWRPNHNGLLSVDLLVGKDTVRVINVQLKSMGVRVEKVIDNSDNKAVVEREARNIFYQLKNGFIKRAEQVKTLENWIKEKKYRTIVCGDFNELPYGYAYGRVRNLMENSFEEAGNGFGFTYNHLPNFLRIDNQFFSNRLIINKFRTLTITRFMQNILLMNDSVCSKQFTVGRKNFNLSKKSMIIFIDDKPIRILEEKEFHKSLHLEDFDKTIDARLESLKPQIFRGRVVVLNPSEANIEKFFQFIFDNKLPDYQGVTFVVKNQKNTETQIRNFYKIVKAAGGIIYNKEGKILMMHRLKKWDLPKGKRDEGEKSRETAAREVAEECNVKVKVGEKVCTTWHTYSMNGNKILKRTKWYKMSCIDSSKMKPQLEEDIDELRWMDEQEIQKALLNSYSSIRYVFECLKGNA